MGSDFAYVRVGTLLFCVAPAAALLNQPRACDNEQEEIGHCSAHA
jgi:hypothetical protein